MFIVVIFLVKYAVRKQKALDAFLSDNFTKIFLQKYEVTYCEEIIFINFICNNANT